MGVGVILVGIGAGESLHYRPANAGGWRRWRRDSEKDG
jgi:hypothetical protein